MEKTEATVAICKCGETHKTYGVRFEKVPAGYWKYTWAFPMGERAAHREGYDATRIAGQIYPDDDYPGCPYCGSKYFLICSCGKISCNIFPDGTRTKCVWCGKTGWPTAYNGSGFRTGGDR